MVLEIAPTSSERDEVVSRLKRAVHDGSLTFEEFEQRIDVAYQAETIDLLHALVNHLPETRQPRKRPRLVIISVTGLVLIIAAYFSVTASHRGSSNPIRAVRSTPSTVPPVSKAMAEHLHASIAPAGTFAYFDPADSCGGFGSATSIGGENCYLVVAFKNDGSRPLTFAPVDLTMVDQHGTKYRVEPVLPECHDLTEINAPYTLQANGTLTVQLCYPVATGALPERLVGTYSLNGLSYPVAPSSVASHWGGM